MKKILATALALVLLLGVFSGCTLVKEDNSNAIVANVNGVSLLKSDYDELYNYYLYMYTSYGYDTETAKSYIDSMASSLLEGLIQDEVLRQKAEAEGYLNYTEEHRKAAQEAVDEEKQAYVDSLVEEYKSVLGDQEIKGKNEGESNEDYFKRVAAEKYDEYLADNGTSAEQMLEDMLLSDAIERFKEDKVKDVKVLDADVLSEYDAILKEQQQEFTTDEIYVNARNGQSVTLSSGSTATYDIFAYNRAGYSLVQHILISYEEADLTKLESIVGTIQEYEEEIADRTTLVENETDEAAKAEEQENLDNAKKQLAEYEEQYDIAIKEATAKIQAKTDEIYNSVKDGDEANFIKVMIENTEDTGMTTEEAAKAGYLVGPEDGMVEEFSTAARALKAGEVSAPVATYYGYHIIRCIENISEGKVEYEDIKEELTEKLTSEKQDSEWSTMVTEWTNAATVKKYEDRL